MKSVMDISPFAFCKSCKVLQKCCTILKPDGVLGAPFLTEDDKRRIEDYLGQSARSFDQREFDPESGEHLTSIKTRAEGGCIFYKGNRCQIYDMRPLDCRIFPLDVFKIGTDFYWIIYNTFCRAALNYKLLQDYGEKLLWHYKVDLEKFASRMEVSPPVLSFEIIGKVRRRICKQC